MCLAAGGSNGLLRCCAHLPTYCGQVNSGDCVDCDGGAAGASGAGGEGDVGITAVYDSLKKKFHNLKKMFRVSHPVFPKP
eukprot:1995520-Rhodomonas_salina.5